MFRGRKGQSTLEYSVLIAIVVAALLAMQIYMKRGVQGKLRAAADDIGQQFDAHRTSSGSINTRTGKTVEVTDGGRTFTYAGLGGNGNPDIVIKNDTEEVGKWTDAAE